MYMKCRYLDEFTGSKGVVFATGTPVSNSMVELYTMQRYLQHDRLEALGLGHFDAWAANFGETVTAMELAPEGTGYRARTRFSKFFNLPELMSLFREVADIKTADELNLPKPKVVYHNEVSQPTQIQKQMVKALSERASRVHARLVEPEVDNMLAITNDGRKLGLDQRVVNPLLPDEPGTKVNKCVDNVFRNADISDYNSFLSFCLAERADAEIAKQRAIPIYDGTAREANERGEVEKFKASRQADSDCREAIENAIARNYDGSRLNTKAAIAEVREQFGEKRMARVTASLIANRQPDGRISPENMKWAEKNATTKKAFTDRTHSGLLDIFATRLRENERKRAREAER